MGPRPRNPKPFSGSNTKAPGLPKPKGKRRPVQAVDDDDDAGPSVPPTNHGSGASGASGGAGPPRTGGSKKSPRSFWGFLGAAASAVAVWGWAVVHQAAESNRQRTVLDSMLRRPLRFTQHATCRMDCRFVTPDQVEQTLRRGTINARKSEPLMRPCPKYVVDAELAVGAGVREVEGVFAACRSETRVITVIDKTTNWPCGPC